MIRVIRVQDKSSRSVLSSKVDYDNKIKTQIERSVVEELEIEKSSDFEETG